MDNTRLPLSRKNITFRVVTEAKDIPSIVQLAREAHEESRFSYIPFSPDKASKIAISAIKNSQRHGVFLAEANGRPVGFSFCSIGEYHVGDGSLIATINNINIIKSIRSSLIGGKIAIGLFTGTRTWAKSRNACEIIIHVTSGVNMENTHNLLKRMSYKTIGGSYAAPINNQSTQ